MQSLLRQGPVFNDEFSIPFMEQWTLDAIGVLIISPTAGGGGLGQLRCNVDSEGGKYTLVRFPNPLAFGSGLGERTPKKVVF